MLLTLSAICMRSYLVKGRAAKPRVDMLDLPQFTRQELGLHGLNLSTELLAGVPCELHVTPGGYHAFDLLQAKAGVSKAFRASYVAALRAALLDDPPARPS